MDRVKKLTVLLAVWLLFLGLALAGSSVPRLVVYVIVDQMRADTFDRLGDLFVGGLGYIRENGVYFSEAYHAHAYPATGPGHFVLATGRYPGAEGIIGNRWYDRNRRTTVYCIGDERSRPLSGSTRGVSYRNIQSTALGDWMKKADYQSKVYSIAGKDRAAVIMGGKRPDGAFWFDFNRGEYVTTDYYMESYPRWLEQFSQQKYLDRYVGSDWTHLLNDEQIYLQYSRRDDFPQEIILAEESQPVFPHHFPEPEDNSSPDYQRLWRLPWLPEASLEVAKAIIVNEELGSDSHPDLLCIGFSVTDAVGHGYGPFSQEVMDLFLRLDRMLGDFFGFLDDEIGLANVLIVLSSDHGSAMLPEYAKQVGLDAGRFGQRYEEMAKELNEQLRRRWGEGQFIDRFSNGSVYYDYSTLSSKGISVKEMDEEVIPFLLNEHWISRVITRSDLMNGSNLDQVGRMWKNQFHPETSGDLFLVFREHWIYRESFGTSHGTAHDYDTHVPLVFAAHGFSAKTVQGRVETVDVAPTIANLLGIEYPAGVDGNVLELGARP